MSEMKERVARAIAVSVGSRMAGPGQSVATREFGWKGDGGHLDQYVEAHWKEHVHAAEFAIEAMREPTEEMQTKGRIMAAICVKHEATNEYSAEVTDDAAINIWQEMIDAALETVPA